MTARLSRPEFVALTAMLMASSAFAIDAMLPALPVIAAEMTPDAPNRAQLIVTSFVLGMGFGTLFTGPLSDAWGRKPVLIGGAVLYSVAAALTWAAGSLELMLAARMLQGVGAASARVVAVAMVRDLYHGRDMARIMSFGMMVFSLVPALAPSLGALIIDAAGWRAIFPALIVFTLSVSLWLSLRQPETLARAARRPLEFALLWQGLKMTLSSRTARIAIACQMLSAGMLFAVLSSTQSVFDLRFGQGAQFPLWFMAIAALAATAGPLNAALVGRVGLRVIVRAAYLGQVLAALTMIATLSADVSDSVTFWVYFVWTVSVFYTMGLTMANLNAMLMEPLGHIAGLAASTAAALSTVGAVLIAVPIGQAFDGTPLPIAIGIGGVAMVALALSLVIRDNC